MVRRFDRYDSGLTSMKFYGFDSFEGLPEETLDKNSPWPTGKFSVAGKVDPQLLANPNINIIFNLSRFKILWM